MRTSITHLASLLQAIVTDAERPLPPDYFSRHPQPPKGRSILLVDWGAANAAAFERHASAREMAETPHDMGNVLTLQLMLAVGIGGESDLFSRELAAFAPWLLGPPHSTERGHWEAAAPLPRGYWNRLKALRRRAHIWANRDPDLLPRLVAKFEAALGADLLWAAGKRDVPGGHLVTPLDHFSLARRVLDPRKGRPAPVPLPVVRTTPAEELLAVEHQERLGAVAKFADPGLHQNYLFVKLSSYVRNVWELQEETPALDYASALDGRDLAAEDLAAGVARVRAWLTTFYKPAGEGGTARVLGSLGLDPSDDHLVVYRRRRTETTAPPRPHKPYEPRLHRVKPPADLGLPGDVRVRARDGTLYVNPADLGTTADEAVAAFVAAEPNNAAARREVVAKSTSRVGPQRYLAPRVAAASAAEAVRRWVDEEFALPGPAWVDRHARRVLAERRAKGERVRTPVAFTTEEDRHLLASVRPYTPTHVWEAMEAAWPHHAPRRIHERGHLLLALFRKRFDFAQPVTREAAEKILGKGVARKYARGF